MNMLRVKSSPAVENTLSTPTLVPGIQRVHLDKFDSNGKILLL